MPALWVTGLTDTIRIVGGGGGDISGIPALWVTGLTDTIRIVGGGGRYFWYSCFVGNWSN